MFDFIHKLHQVLNMIKGLEAGYSTSEMHGLIVKHNEKVFKVEIRYVGEGEVNDHMYRLRNSRF